MGTTMAALTETETSQICPKKKKKKAEHAAPSEQTLPADFSR